MEKKINNKLSINYRINISKEEFESMIKRYIKENKIKIWTKKQQTK